MSRLAIFDFGEGSFERGFSVNLEIFVKRNNLPVRFSGRLPPSPQVLAHCYQWQLAYRSLDVNKRSSFLEAPEAQTTNFSLTECLASCEEATHQLKASLGEWYESREFNRVREKLLEEISDRTQEIRLVIRTQNSALWQLPWHLFFERLLERYRKAEVSLSLTEYGRAGNAIQATEKVQILAILGDRTGINVEADRQILENLPNASPEFLVEPQREQLTEQLWQQNWQVLFFAGHSSSQAETGRLFINPRESITIEKLKYALQQAIAQGLQLAIFNSCDGLQLARDLAELHIPQLIVMREPVPDIVAQEFLKYFLSSYSNGESLYVAVRQAREKLQGLEDRFPCASWLPVICQNPAEVPLAWHELYRNPEITVSSPDVSQVDPSNQTTLPGRDGTIEPQRILAGHYEIINPLGGGGFGQTFLAKDNHLPGSSLCVVKQLKPKYSDPETLEVAKRLFEQEANILYGLQHDRIPRLLAHFPQDGEFYLVEEYIEGTTLDRELAPGKQLDEAPTIALLQDILQVLAFVHQQNIIHRDIKPANLIRRKRDNKIVLIDFGAVKAVSLQSPDTQGSSNLTVAVGSPGYMPSEQQSGNPQFSSDIYAVGMVCIQALTGLTPSNLQQDPSTSEYDCAELSDHISINPALAAFLKRMVRYDYRQRYENATEALLDLQQLLNANQSESLQELTLSLPKLDKSGEAETDITPKSIPESNQAQHPKSQIFNKLFKLRPVLIASIAITGLVTGIRQLGLMEYMELKAFDQMVQFQPDPSYDPRLLLVSITEDDIQAQGQAAISDRALGKLLTKLETYQPRVVGVDMFRDIAIEPRDDGNLSKYWQSNANLIGVCQGGEGNDAGVPPPAGVLKEQIGFSDLLLDPIDNVVRRQLLSLTPDPNSRCLANNSFSLQLALHYLQKEGLQPVPARENPEYMQLGKVVFGRLQSHTGGYAALDDRGYQMLINWRSPNQIARQVTMTQLLKGEVDPGWVKDKVVLIGYTALSKQDFSATPYSAGQRPYQEMAGVAIHAQMVSQILAAVLDGRPLLQALPYWGDVLWIWVWASFGGMLALVWRQRLFFAIASAGGIMSLPIICYFLFLNGVWMPLIPSGIALVTGCTAMFIINRKDEHNQ